MPRINIVFDEDYGDSDIICVPQSVSDNIKHIPYDCSKWLYDNVNEHNFWSLAENGRKIVNFETESLIWWLNSFYIKDGEKAYVIIQHVECNPEYPIMYL